MSWARLLKRVFDIDIENCSNCGGTLKIIAAPSTGSRIEDPPVMYVAVVSGFRIALLPKLICQVV